MSSGGSAAVLAAAAYAETAVAAALSQTASSTTSIPIRGADHVKITVTYAQIAVGHATAVGVSVG